MKHLSEDVQRRLPRVECPAGHLPHRGPGLMELRMRSWILFEGFYGGA